LFFWEVLAYPHTFLVFSLLIMRSRSNPLDVFALDLKSTYEEEQMIFGLLGLADLVQDDVLEFHPFTCK
jgi:hypothetical protein